MSGRSFRVDEAIELLRRFPQDAEFLCDGLYPYVRVGKDYYNLNVDDKQLPWMKQPRENHDS